MMLSMSPSSVTRSSLEEMLDAIRRRDDDEKPKDLPPSLPSRPSSKARRPSSRQQLSKILEVNKLNHSTMGMDSNGSRIGSFGGNNQIELLAESPYVKATVDKTEHRIDQTEVENHSSSSSRFQACGWNDKIGYFINKKLHVWCRVPSGQWELGKITSTSGEKATVLLSDENVVAEVLTGDILPANPDILEGVDDLIQLSYLNEPSVLHNLQCRYSKDIIYSKAGSVLIAINPFKDVNCYENDFITAYKEKFIDNPHVYAVADTAYNDMMRDGINQSIIISGESGSGKSETAKVAMQYLAAVGGDNSGIKSKILLTSCILEAFGNAKTARNNNSSKFGKLIEIHFGVTGEICGAQIQTFLLEKSRVVQLAHEERSYHIFYQLCAGASSDLKAQFNLKTASEYNYLNQSQCLNINGIDDAQNFKILMEAFNTIRISKEDQNHALQMVAAVLWLGNISFKVSDNENHAEAVSDEALTVSARLLGCRTEDLMSALSTRKIQAGKDIFTKNLTMQQAIDSRDALSKFIYASLFDRLIEEINESLKLGKEYTGTSSISIVDIYGFETLKKNNLEQLCINYANERLQQHFTRHLFKLEQEEYESEGIDWTKVDFKDNVECLDLFEKKPIGLLSLLDEESKFPKANDLTFAKKLKQHLNNNNPHFKGETGSAFVIRHYAGEVLYDTNGFLEKNRDPIHSDILQLLSSSCGNRLLRLFAFDHEKPSVGMEFKNKLFKLMQKLESTTPHFILCIKPNNKQLSGMYEKDLVLEQLRSCGVLSVTRISRNRYPTQVTHQKFARRYALLLRPEDDNDNAGEDPLSISMAVLQQFDIQPEMYQVGYTKLYFRTGQISALEETRKQVLQGTLKTQNQFRSHRVRGHFSELKNGIITLQSFIRGQNARKTLNDKISAVILLQSAIRIWRNKQNNWRKNPEIKEETQELIYVQPSVLEELKRRVSEAEATISQKEKENDGLMKDLQQSEYKCLDYEARMKIMEETWQNKMVALQQTNQVRRDYSPSTYDSEDGLSMGPSTPLQSTPLRILGTAGREPNGGMNVISHMEMEFEHRIRNFEDEVKDVSNSVLSLRPGDELHKLKMRFEIWKKDYKARLRETKAKLRANGERSRRKWWGLRNK